MDYKNYYLQQAEGNVFRGVAFQKGYGLGGAFRRFFSWFVPLLKEHALPVAKNVGKEVVQSFANIATDALNGRDIEESSKNRITQSFEKIQKGRGYKRKRNLKEKIRKRKKVIDIFS